jgi:hypothetical protein
MSTVQIIWSLVSILAVISLPFILMSCKCYGHNSSNDHTHESYVKSCINHLKRFNENLLNGKFEDDKRVGYKNIQDIINKAKKLDKSKIIPYDYSSPYYILGTKRQEEHGFIFKDENKNFRLALDWDLIKETQYRELCLTLDEIEKNVDLDKLVNEDDEAKLKKEESHNELKKLF